MIDDRLPVTADDIDAAWLDGALQERHPGARVAEVELLGADEVTNSHVRLRVSYDEPAGAPERMFGKLLPLDPTRRETIARTQMGPREARFYATLAPSVSMRVPEMHVAKTDDRDGSFVVLIEDLDAAGCRMSDGTWGIGPDAAAAALEDLADLHVRFEDPARRAAEAPWVVPPTHGSTYATDRLQHGIDHHRDRLSDAFVDVSQLYIADRGALHGLWLAGPATVVHGDTHIGNLFDDHGRTGFLDWGVINLSPPMRDVSYFLNMAMQVEDRRAHDAELIRHYLAVRKAKGGAEIGFDQAWHEHRLQAAYCVPASCQVVNFPEDITEQRRIFADAFLERAEAAVEDLESGDAVREALGS